MDLKDKTTAQLKNELKSIQMITGVLIGILSILFIICVIGLFTKENNTVFSLLIVVPIALSTIIPFNYGNMKKIKKELSLRE